jgi:hypothetical protein
MIRLNLLYQGSPLNRIDRIKIRRDKGPNNLYDDHYLLCIDII